MDRTKAQKLMRRMTGSFAVMVVSLIAAMVVSGIDNDVMSAVFVFLWFFAIGAFWIYHFSLGKLASMFGKSAIVWACGSFLTSPIGPIVTFVLMRREFAEQMKAAPTASGTDATNATGETPTATTGTKTCPFCAEEIQSAAVKCKHCGEMLRDPARPSVEVEPKKKRSKAQLVGVFAILVVGIFVIVGIVGSNLSDTSTVDRPTRVQEASVDPSALDKPKPRKPKRSNTHPIYGEAGILRAGRNGDVPVAATKESYERLIQLVGANDTMGVQALIDAGYVTMVDVNTEVVVIGTDWSRFEVRIQSGRLAGRSVFVKRDFVWSVEG